MDSKSGFYFEMLRFCRITERNSLRNSRNENGGRPRFTLLKDVDDDDDVVLLDEVEHLAVRSCDPQIGTILVSLDHDGDTVILPPPPPPPTHPSISSQSMVVDVVAVVAVDEVDADRKGGNGGARLLLFVSLVLRIILLFNGSIGYLVGFSSVGLLLALVSVLSHPTFECLQLLLLVPPPLQPQHVLVFGLNEKSNIEFCSFVIENSEELELALTGIISSKSLDLGRFGKLESRFVAISYRFSTAFFRSAESITLKPMD